MTQSQILKAGLLFQKTENMYWENGISFQYTFAKFKPNQFFIGFDYTSSRFKHVKMVLHTIKNKKPLIYIRGFF